jgi:fumarate reductase flavoprotein subunit
MAFGENDVIVVGSGASGMAAALTAVKSGRRVVVIEKNRYCGGISNLGMEIFAVESKIQRKNNISITVNEAFKIFMEHTHWNADARLVRAFIGKTASTIEWLQGLGVEFEEISSFFMFPESKLTAHPVKLPSGRSGPGSFANMMKILRRRAEGKGVEFLFSTAARKLIKENNKVTGLIAETSSKETVQIRAKAVIIASGGFANNPEMLKKCDQFGLSRDLSILPSVKLTGDGIEMAWQVGASSDGMCIAFFCDSPAPKNLNGTTKKAFSAITRQPYLWVNQQGKRFMDEGIVGCTVYAGNAIARQKNKCAYLIFDENTRYALEQKGLDYMLPIARDLTNIINLDSLVLDALHQGHKNVFIADSLAELSVATGIDSSALQETVDEYNGFCDNGRDELFFKYSKYLQPVRQPRFYSFRIRNVAYGTVGGIKINERAEVLNQQDELIPGLYAAGDCANGATSHDFSLAFLLRGNPSSFALNTGRIAGESALRYIGK